jgi:hypothetical protein
MSALSGARGVDVASLLDDLLGGRALRVIKLDPATNRDVHPMKRQRTG